LSRIVLFEDEIKIVKTLSKKKYKLFSL